MSESNRPHRLPRPPKPLAAVVVCFQVILGLLPFAQLAIGAVYQFDCPRQPYIPIYLLVMGVISLMLTVLYATPCTARFGDQSKIWSCFVFVFFFCWFIAGNVWIYSIYEPNYNKTASSSDTYCNKTLYLFAFWTTNLNYILFGLVLLSSCCSCLLCGDD